MMTNIKNTVFKKLLLSVLLLSVLLLRSRLLIVCVSGNLRNEIKDFQ